MRRPSGISLAAISTRSCAAAHACGGRQQDAAGTGSGATLSSLSRPVEAPHRRHYRNELRMGLQTIGYATLPTLVDQAAGVREIAGYGQPMLDAFSTRRSELLDYTGARLGEHPAHLRC